MENNDASNEEASVGVVVEGGVGTGQHRDSSLESPLAVRNQQSSTTTSPSANSVISTVLSTGPTSTLATTSVRASAASSRRVRRNWWGYIVESFRSISRTSKVLLILSLSMVLIQILLTIIVLVTSRNQRCDRDLRLFLEIYIIRVMLACPVNVYLYLNPRENRNRVGQNENERRRDGWVDRLKSFLDLFATLWFIVGNYLLFTTSTCQRTAPAVFFLALTWVILGYIIITIPILLCLAVIFCLPCVLVVMRILHVNEAVGISGASEDVIKKIPLMIYKAPANETTEADSEVSDTVPSSVSTNEPLSATKQSRFKLPFGKKDKKPSAPTQVQYLTIPNEDDALCSICLSSYENGEELRQLWCMHHFHKDCVDEWLRQNRRCPMCRVDVVEMAEERANLKKDKGSSTGNTNEDGESAGEGSSTPSGQSTLGERNENVIDKV